MTTPGSGEWRCSNCGDVADHLDDGTLIDVRYALGYCSSCSLRGKVPLMRATHAEAMAIVTARKGQTERDKQRIGLRSGAIPTHVYAAPSPGMSACCKSKRSDHLTRAQLDAVMDLLA